MKSYQIVVRNLIIDGADKVKNVCNSNAACYTEMVLTFMQTVKGEQISKGWAMQKLTSIARKKNVYTRPGKKHKISFFFYHEWVFSNLRYENY